MYRPPLTYSRQQLKAIVMLKVMLQLINIPTDTILQSITIWEITQLSCYSQMQESMHIYIHFSYPV